MLQLEAAAFTQNDHYLAASKARFLAQYKTARMGAKVVPSPAPAPAPPPTAVPATTVDPPVVARPASVSTVPVLVPVPERATNAQRPPAEQVPLEDCRAPPPGTVDPPYAPRRVPESHNVGATVSVYCAISTMAVYELWSFEVRVFVLFFVLRARVCDRC